MQFVKNVQVQHPETKEYHFVTVRVAVDEDRLAEAIAKKCLASKNGRAAMQGSIIHGAITRR